MEIANIKRLSLKSHTTLSEQWVQSTIAANPAILGLGDLVLKDKERMQPRAGRLDLLLQDIESNQRFEVEVQLGPTDESHIIRTLEYWDIERKRYPQYEHTAVIVAEDITSRFLNVISLFNGAVPFVAIQMNAIEVDGKVGLFFTTVLNQLNLGLVEEDEEVQEVTDRIYWEGRASNAIMSVVDRIFEIAKKYDPEIALNYNKYYIGLARCGKSTNYFTMTPKKNFVRFSPRILSSADTLQILEDAGLDVMDHKWGRYRINVKPDAIPSCEQGIEHAIQASMGIDTEKSKSEIDDMQNS